jgi:hypothetical protein
LYGRRHSGGMNFIWAQLRNSGTCKTMIREKHNRINLKAEQASNTFTFTDVFPPIGTVYYLIEIENPNACNINDFKSSNNYYEISRSNIVNSYKVTSTDNISVESFELFPNSTQEKLYIKSNFEFDQVGFLIYSLDGKVLLKERKLEKEIDISSLKSGMYLIRLNNQVKTITLKFIKP